MAMGLLRAGEQVDFDDAGCLFLGELGLDGTLEHISATLRWSPFRGCGICGASCRRMRRSVTCW
jgi:hypothetical protein